MVFYLPESSDGEINLDEMTPRQTVRELDKYVVGQKEAKRAVAVALRNRMRRLKLPPEMADEVAPEPLGRDLPSDASFRGRVIRNRTDCLKLDGHHAQI